ARCGYGLPELRALSAHDGVREYRVPAVDPPRAKGGDPPPGGGSSADARPDRTTRPPSQTVVGRAAPARGARPGGRAPAPRVPVRRAAFQSRCTTAGAHAGGNTQSAAGNKNNS